MAKQLNVNMTFTADVTQATAAAKKLQADLMSLGNNTGLDQLGAPLTQNIIRAQSAAKELSGILKTSFNESTGRLDLTKFNAGLVASGKTLSTYSHQLGLLGNEGDQAFLKLAHAIVQSEVPLKRTNKVLSEFGTSLKNTVRWQLSSSILHGFMGTIQSAYGYAKDLNKSLTNIRIVTQNSAEEMATFAEQANKAARALNTTTTNYTNASLIYFQQGLTEEEVKERTDITIKMAQASGQSAEIVSDQLTAVWNNFAKGGESLEYYADVMTALGAKTASSSEEIAGGLEKFASIADMIGLSYEYAASALATITATTRQSEDVVGTALKTIFARIQGLSLGETLDDGTTLNKYSEALDKVGINIFTQNGQLKEMNNILDEIGSKWETLTTAQQTALAQTVAGVRQYNQLVSLFENWDVFQEDVNIATNSSGSLQAQADVYADSWGGARNRLKASLQGIYQDLVSDDFFIGLTDGFTEITDFLNQFIDALGGLKGVLFALGTVFTSVFKEQMANGINNALYNFKTFSGQTVQEAQRIKREAYEMAMAMTEGLADNPRTQALRASLQTTYTLQNELNQEIRRMSPEQAKVAKGALEIAQNYNKAVIEAAELVVETEKLIEAEAQVMSRKSGALAQRRIVALNQNASTQEGYALSGVATDMIAAVRRMGSFEGKSAAIQQASHALQLYNQALRLGIEDEQVLIQHTTALRTALNGLTQTTATSTTNFTNYQMGIRDSASAVMEHVKTLQRYQQIASERNFTESEIVALKALREELDAAGIDVRELQNALSYFHKSGKVSKFGPNPTEEQRVMAYQRLNQAILNVGMSEDQMILRAANLARQYNQEEGAVIHLATSVAELSEEELRLARIHLEGARNQEDLNNKILQGAQLNDRARNSINNTGLAYKTLGSAITGGVQGLSTFAMGLSSISTIWKTLENPDLSGFEKALQLMMSFGMAIPMLTMGVTSLNNARRFLMSTQNEGLIISLANLFAIDKENEGIKKTATLNGVLVATREAGAEAAFEQTVAERGLTVETEAQTKVVLKNIGVKILQHSWILLVAGALTILATGLTIASKLYNSEANAAEKAAESAKNAAKAFSTAQEAYNSFKGSIDDYSNAINGLKDLTEGTNNYKEKIIEANKAALALIDTHNLIKNQDYWVDEKTGLIKLNTKTLSNIQSEQLKDLEGVQGYQTFANQRKRATQLKEEQNKLNKEKLQGTGINNKDSLAGSIGSAAVLGAGTLAGLAFDAYTATKLGTAIGSAIAPGIGTAIGAVAGLAIGSVISYKTLSNKSTTEENEALKALAEQVKTDGDNRVFEEENLREFLRETKGFSVELTNSIIKNREAVEKQIEALNANTEALRASLEQNVVSANRDDEYYNSLTNSEKIIMNKIVANRATESIENSDFDYYSPKNNYGNKMLLGQEKEVLDEYLKIRFGEDAENYRIKNTFGTNNTLERRNEEGTWERIGDKNSLTNEEIIEFLTQKELLKVQFEDKVQANKIETVGRQLDSISGINNEAINSIMGNLAEGESVDLSVLSPEQKTDLENKLKETGNWLSDTYFTALQDGIMNYDEKLYHQRQELEADAIISQGAADLELPAEALEAYTEELLENNSALKGNKKLAAEAAVASAKFGNNLDKLEKTLKDNVEAINKEKDSLEKSLDYYEALGNVQKDLEETFGIEVDSDFIIKNLKEIEAAATGDVEAVEKLRTLLTDEFITKIVVENELSDVQAQEVLSAYNNLKAMMPDISVGATLDDGPFIDALNEMILAAGMTTPTVNQLLTGMGMSATFAEEPQKISDTLMMTTTYTETTPLPDTELEDGTIVSNYRTREYVTQEPVSSENYINAWALETAPPGEAAIPEINSITRNPPPLKTNRQSGKSGGGGGGGGGSKPKKAKRTPRSEIIERYKEIEDQLDDVKDATDKASKAVERLYGKERIKKMEEVNDQLQKEIKLLQQQREEAKKYKDEDWAKLQEVASKEGLNFIRDDNGNIINYEKELNKLWKELEAAEIAAGDELDENEQEIIDAIKERIEPIKEAISIYDETKEKFEEINQEIQDKKDEIQDNNYEKLNYEIELKIDIEDSELEKLEYYLNKYNDDFFKLSETLEKTVAQSEIYENLLNIQSSQDKQAGKIADLKKKYDENEISQAQYIEGLKEANEAILQQLENLNELEKELTHFYEDALSSATSELKDYIDHMEHLNGVFDHYVNLMEILGKQKDFDSMGNFLTGKSDIVRSRLDIAKDYYNTLVNQRMEVERQLKDAIAANDKEAIDFYKKQMDYIIDETDAAQEEVLSLTEEWAEAMKAIVENNMQKIAQTLEKALTNEHGFEKLMSDFDKLNTKQEEYLTNTNKIYETNKLMRTANKALDETDNKIAKQKIKNFIDETKSLQENTQLSQYELDIQQAKYDLLLAEIALEEAQNAKSTVRLTRDSEGNFGYVYTADQDKVDDAEQKVDDAENKLYNTSLDGQKNYTEKYLQAQEEMFNELEELREQYLNGEITSEEDLQKRMSEVQDYYYGVPNGILTIYQRLYNIAVQTDTKATADFWATEYGNMIQDTKKWKEAVSGYIFDISEETADWAEVSKIANEDVEEALSNSEDATRNLTDENKILASDIKNNLIPALNDELEAVKKLILNWDTLKKIKDTVSTYEGIYDDTQDKIESESKLTYDSTKDYSLLMNSSYGTADYEIYKKFRNKKIAEDKKDVGMATTENIDKLLSMGLTLEKLGVSSFTAISEERWKELLKNPTSLDSGGYTGDWGPEGKLAFLHQKELVLNQKDTENLLLTVSFVRDLANLIDARASMASLSSLMAFSGITASNQPFEQHIEIYADFPDATDHFEIEQAFNSLVNRASQYANRK